MNEPLAALVAAVHEHDWSCSEGGHANEPDGCPECEHFRQLALTAIPPDAVLVTEEDLATAMRHRDAEKRWSSLHSWGWFRDEARAILIALRAHP